MNFLPAYSEEGPTLEALEQLAKLLLNPKVTGQKGKGLLLASKEELLKKIKSNEEKY